MSNILCGHNFILIANVMNFFSQFAKVTGVGFTCAEADEDSGRGSINKLSLSVTSGYDVWTMSLCQDVTEI